MVVSTENYGWLKMVLIDVFGPGTVALGIFMLFLLRCHLVFTIFPFPVITAQFTVYRSSGKISEMLRAM
jgi:hypothetical protein